MLNIFVVVVFVNVFRCMRFSFHWLASPSSSHFFGFSYAVVIIIIIVIIQRPLQATGWIFFWHFPLTPQILAFQTTAFIMFDLLSDVLSTLGTCSHHLSIISPQDLLSKPSLFCLALVTLKQGNLL